MEKSTEESSILLLSRIRSKILSKKERLTTEVRELERELAQVDDAICKEITRQREAGGIIP